jgi:hypothetical protein
MRTVLGLLVVTPQHERLMRRDDLHCLAGI